MCCFIFPNVEEQNWRIRGNLGWSSWWVFYYAYRPVGRSLPWGLHSRVAFDFGLWPTLPWLSVWWTNPPSSKQWTLGLAERPRWHVERWDSCVKWSSGRRTKAFCWPGSHSILNAGCSLYRHRHCIHVMEDGHRCKEMKMPIDAVKCCGICERSNIKKTVKHKLGVKYIEMSFLVNFHCAKIFELQLH